MDKSFDTYAEHTTAKKWCGLWSLCMPGKTMASVPNACGSGPNILILRYRHPAHAQNIVVPLYCSALLSMFRCTQNSLRCVEFFQLSHLGLNSLEIARCATFSPSSGGSSASNLLEPSRTTSSTPNSCKNSTRPAISVMLTPPPRSDRVRSTVVQAHLTSSNLLEPHHYRDSLLPLAIANNALHCTSTHPTNVHMYVHLLGTCMYNVPLYIHPTNTHTEWVSVQEMFISCC